MLIKFDMVAIDLEKILIFGGSLGGENYINNNTSYEILGVIDNNIEKQGGYLNSIRIISPSEITNYDFDKIIVTSMYVHSIEKQLLDMNIDSNIIEFASKNSLKTNDPPFQDKRILDKAYLLITKLNEILYDVPHFYSYGTLLGIARDGELIPWDDDIDIAIFGKDSNLILKHLMVNFSELESIFNVRLVERVYKNGTPASINIECYENDSCLFIVNFDCMNIEGEIVRQELSDTPLEYFNGNDEIQYRETTIKTPKNYKEYLTYSYGDWTTVRKNTSFANNSKVFREPIMSSSSIVIMESKVLMELGE